MNIHFEKLSLIGWITGLTDLAIIEKLKKIQAENPLSSDGWDELSTYEKESIEKGMKDIREGRVNSHETVRKTYEKYL
jgi:predicted transcriptional regulator